MEDEVVVVGARPFLPPVDRVEGAWRARACEVSSHRPGAKAPPSMPALAGITHRGFSPGGRGAPKAPRLGGAPQCGEPEADILRVYIIGRDCSRHDHEEVQKSGDECAGGDSAAATVTKEGRGGGLAGALRRAARPSSSRP